MNICDLCEHDAEMHEGNTGKCGSLGCHCRKFRVLKAVVSKEVAAAAVEMGRAGGKSGKGDSKRRGAMHYRVTLAEARRLAKLKRKLNESV